MRNQSTFMAGMLAGLALGSLMVIAMTPEIRDPMMEGMGHMGGRFTDQMGRMWRRGTHMAEAMMPGDAH